MTRIGILSAIAAVGLLSACAYPVTTVDLGAAASGVFFVNAPAGSSVSVDGTQAGSAASYDGVQSILTLSPGKHRVVVSGPSGVEVDRTVYVGAGQRVSIKVR